MSEIDYGNPDYFYGIDYMGRGVGIMWFDNKHEAMEDAKFTDQKHLPAELVRVRKSAVERSGFVYDYSEDAKDLRWQKN